LRRPQRSRGITPVIATIILSAVVIAVGGAVWSYAQGAATVFANDYVNDTFTLLNEVIERFTIEHVCNNSDRDELYVWIYNYGEVDIVIDLYANTSDNKGSFTGTEISSGEFVKITVSFSPPLYSGDEVAIKAHSRRENNAYYKHYVS
jgi:flagellin-like protein